jgi:hypothetical protein
MPNTFGAGFPWYMMLDLYHKIYTGSFQPGNTEEMDKRFLPFLTSWWSFGFNSSIFAGTGLDVNTPTKWVNQPTLATNQAKLARLQIIRISKNTYMLTAVKKYVRHGLVDNGQQFVGYKPGLVLTEHKKLSYRPVTTPVYPNVLSTSGATPYQRTPVGYRHTMLLTKIERVAVDHSTLTQEYSFGYKRELLHLSNNSSCSWSTPPPSPITPISDDVFSKYFMLLPNPILLDTYVDPLGATKKITYYPIGNLMIFKHFNCIPAALQLQPFEIL